MKKDYKISIGKRHFAFFKAMLPHMDGGLSLTLYTSAPECEFTYFVKRYGVKVLNGCHLTGYAYSLDSRKMEVIMNICKTHNVFFVLEPDIKACDYASNRYQFGFVVPDKKEMRK
jgi:hypothetical protein